MVGIEDAKKGGHEIHTISIVRVSRSPREQGHSLSVFFTHYWSDQFALLSYGNESCEDKLERVLGFRQGPTFLRFSHDVESQVIYR